MEPVMIRECRPEDITRTAQFYDNVILWLDAHINYPLWVYRVYPNEDSVWRMTEEGAQYICIQEGSIVGAFALSTEPQGNFQKGQWSLKLTDGSYLVLRALATDPGVQRQGLGSEIIRFCIEKARSEGYRAVRADIVPTNGPARKLFEKNGFTYAGDADLELGIERIPAFSLYEFNL